MYGYIYSKEMGGIVGIADKKASFDEIPNVLKKDMEILKSRDIYDKNDSEETKINKLFTKADKFWEFSNKNGVISVYIDGDWKHDHAFCDSLMRSLGYNLEDEINVIEDGSDWYSSEHIYVK